MGLITAIEIQVADLEKTKGLLRNELMLAVEALPDNKAIKKLSDSTFTMNVSSLSKNFRFDPFYYDYKRQYRVISDIIRDDPDFMIELKSIIELGKATHKGKKYSFNPAVIAHLMTLI